MKQKRLSLICVCLIPVLRSHGERSLLAYLEDNGDLWLPHQEFGDDKTAEQACSRLMLKTNGLPSKAEDWQPLLTHFHDQNLYICCSLDRAIDERDVIQANASRGRRAPMMSWIDNSMAAAAVLKWPPHMAAARKFFQPNKG